MTSEPTPPPVVPPLHSPKSPVWPTFPFHREGSRVWERGGVSSRDLPSPLPTKRTRTYSATARASAGPVFKGVCKQFSRSQGHGFITPENGSEDIFVHVSDIEGEYVPVEGDEVTERGRAGSSRKTGRGRGRILAHVRAALTAGGGRGFDGGRGSADGVGLE
uniref:Cold shock domain containing C2 n=1 Tax=Sus scrofa TaxID=9823 RepID=A0A8D1U6G1_PIG